MNNDYKKCTICQLNIYSMQMLPTRVFVFHQCQPNHGTVFQASVITLRKEKKKRRVKQQWNEGGKILGCGGENDKEGKNETGETGEIKGAETDSGRGGFLVSEQRQARKREGEGKRGAIDVMANHFPSNRVRSSSLMQQHQGNGWCGADMLLWLVVLV